MDRSELALRLRKEGLTYREIGERLGVSRQRAFQLVERAGRVPVFRKVCANCGETFETSRVKARFCPRCRAKREKFRRCVICGERHRADELVSNGRGRPTSLCKACAAKIRVLAERGVRNGQ